MSISSVVCAMKGMFKACESLAQRSCIRLVLCAAILCARASTYGETHFIHRISGMLVWNDKHYCEVVKDATHRECTTHRLDKNGRDAQILANNQTNKQMKEIIKKLLAIYQL